MTISRLLLLLFLSISIFACKNDKKNAVSNVIKNGNINLRSALNRTPIDTIKARLNLPNNKVKKLEKINEKYKTLIRKASQKKSNDNLDDLRRRKEFELKVLLGDSLKTEYDKLLIEKRRILKRKK